MIRASENLNNENTDNKQTLMEDLFNKYASQPNKQISKEDVKKLINERFGNLKGTSEKVLKLLEEKCIFVTVTYIL